MPQRRLYSAEEHILIHYKMVRRRHNNRCIGVLLLELVSCICYTRGRIPAVRLQQNVFRQHLRQLLLYQLPVLLTRYHHDILAWNNLGKSVVGLLQKRDACTKKVQELFRLAVPAHGPETAPDPSGHNNAIIVFSTHIFHFTTQVQTHPVYTLF